MVCQKYHPLLFKGMAEAIPCLIISKQLKTLLSHNSFSGYQLDTVEVSKSSQFYELYPGKQLPEFYWLKVTGILGKDDFGLAKDYRLVISERILGMLRQVSIVQADIEDF